MNCLPSLSLIVNPSPTQFSTCLAFHFHRHILLFVILLAQLYMCCVLQITRHTFLLKEHLNRLQKIFQSYRILKASFNESRAMFHYLLDFWTHLDFYILHSTETSECASSAIFISKKSQICPGFRQWPGRDEP